MPHIAFGALAVASIFLLTACGRDSFPLRNAKTGQEVVCSGPYYLVAPSINDMESVSHCITACAQAGFSSQNKPVYVMQPLTPRAQLRVPIVIPFACMSSEEKKQYLDMLKEQEQRDKLSL